MPTARLSTAKTVARGTAPLVASVRGLHLPHQPIIQIGSPSEIQIQTSVEIQAFPARLGDGLVLELPFDFLEALSIEDMSAAIPPIPIAQEPLSPDSGSAPIGRRFVPGAATQEADVVDFLRPLIEPPVAPTEMISAREPILRPYQVEAIQALMAQDGLLLADEMGTGKTTAACEAILALVQRGQARRSLIVGPAHSLRYWRDRLCEWAPSLVTSWIRGNRKEREQAWRAQAHVLIVDYAGLVDDIDKGVALEPELGFDIVVMDDLHLLPDLDTRVEQALAKLGAVRRWGLAGLLPSDPDAWRSEFGCLLPGRPHPASSASTSDLQKWFMPNVLRRTREQLRTQLPPVTRQERWLDLSYADYQACGEAMAEERHRLENSKGHATLEEIEAALARLRAVIAFPTGRGSAKVEALLDLLDEVVRDGRKVVIQACAANVDRLLPMLGPYGVVALRQEQSADDRMSWLKMFREPSGAQVLVTHAQALQGMGPFPEVAVLVLFDPDPDPADRLAIETIVRPEPGSPMPLHSVELWTVGTVDEQIAGVLDSQGIALKPSKATSGLTVADWLEKVFRLTRTSTLTEPSLPQVPVEAATETAPVEAATTSAPAPAPAGPPPMLPRGTGKLPGTDLLRSQLQDLPPDALLSGVARWMQALGFPEAENVVEPSESGGELVAWRETDAGTERALVRCIRSGKNVGIAEAKALLKELDERTDCLGGYLVVTTDFTPACKKVADESDGRLTLVSGGELWRHLHIQGLLPKSNRPPGG